MARHNDINRAAALLDGVQGWSIKTYTKAKTKQKSGIAHKPLRKNRRRCLYFNKLTERCGKSKTLCVGSSKCTMYRDKKGLHKPILLLSIFSNIFRYKFQL